jgi:osmoprotectant transport system substrate-binding protein
MGFEDAYAIAVKEDWARQIISQISVISRNMTQMTIGTDPESPREDGMPRIKDVYA